MAEYEFVAALGRKLGLKTADGKDFFLTGRLAEQPIEDLTHWYEDFLSSELKNGGPAMTLAELQQLPGAVWVDKGGTRYRKYREPVSDAALATAFVDGDLAKDGTAIYDKPKDSGGKRIGTVIGGSPLRCLFTPSGKVEFFNAAYATQKDVNGNPVDALPVYKPRDWLPDAEFPLYLINWKEASHTHTRSQNNAWLLDIKPSNPLVIHPDFAEKLGIREGDEVWVESRNGRERATTKLSLRMHPEVVGAQHGFGHWRLGQAAAGRGSRFGDLNTIAYDALSGQGLHKEICVKVYKV
jgi:anaerobic selenocysteine-containing dehydrogenase